MRVQLKEEEDAHCELCSACFLCLHIISSDRGGDMRAFPLAGIELEAGGPGFRGQGNGFVEGSIDAMVLPISDKQEISFQ